MEKQSIVFDDFLFHMYPNIQFREGVQKDLRCPIFYGLLNTPCTRILHKLQNESNIHNKQLLLVLKLKVLSIVPGSQRYGDATAPHIKELGTHKYEDT